MIELALDVDAPTVQTFHPAEPGSPDDVQAWRYTERQFQCSTNQQVACIPPSDDPGETGCVC